MAICSKKILYFIQLPPPVHGVSIINKQVYESKTINCNLDIDLLEIKFSDQIHELRRITIKKLLLFVRYMFVLIKRLRSFRPGYVYFSIMPVGPGFLRDAIFVFIIKLFRVRLIYHIHNQGIRQNSENSILRWLYKIVFKRSSVIHLSTNLIEKEFGGLHLQNTFFYAVPNGIPLNSNYSGFYREIKSIKNILFLSHINRNKGIEILLRALKMLNDENKEFSLTIAGNFYNAGYEKKIKNLIAHYKLLNKITICGEVNLQDRWKLYQQADLFVFPSLNDTFPLVILEALQAGLPIITTNTGACPEIISDGNEGMLVDINDSESLFKAIKSMSENVELANKMGHNAHQQAEKYSLEKFEQRMSDVFNTIFSTEQKDQQSF